MTLLNASTTHELIVMIKHDIYYDVNEFEGANFGASRFGSIR